MNIYTVDAFSSAPFQGNPAAVCIVRDEIDLGLMQRIAFEMNLSETAFVRVGEQPFGLRWFTPRVEVDLCGHATLASAHVLWETRLVEQEDKIEFSTRSGILTARKHGPWVEMDFPTEAPVESPAPPFLSDALGVRPLWVGRTRFDYLVEVGSEEVLRGITPDFALLAKVECRGVIVTCGVQSGGYDFASRFFAPAVGINEDPVTGSAHCSLAPFWSGRTGRNSFTARQASERGGTLKVRAAGERTFISGQAVTVVRGETAPLFD